MSENDESSVSSSQLRLECWWNLYFYASFTIDYIIVWRDWEILVLMRGNISTILLERIIKLLLGTQYTSTVALTLLIDFAIDFQWIIN